jgi:DNA-binding LytR/AlgR family response regulator
MKLYKSYIVDDEPLAIKVIEQHLSKFGDFELSGSSTEPVKAISQIKLLKPDILFLDIQMPQLTGLDLIESLHHKPSIILTTAYRDFAVEGFELNVLDYLVKPISLKRFTKAIDKFLELQAASGNTFADSSSFLLVKAERKTVKINTEDILHVEGVKDYVRIVLKDQTVITKISIGNFLKELPPGRFTQVHKSFIVSMDKITAYTAHDVEIGGKEIPIGRVYKEDFIRRMNEG